MDSPDPERKLPKKRSSVLREEARKQQEEEETASVKRLKIMEKEAAENRKAEAEEVAKGRLEDFYRRDARRRDFLGEKERLATLSPDVQVVYRELEALREDKAQQLDLLHNRKKELKKLIPVDTAMAYLLYAEDDAASALAKKIQAAPEDIRLQIAEEEGRVFWDIVISKVSNVTKTPGASLHGSDVGDEESVNEGVGVESSSSEQAKRAKQDTLAAQLHRIQLGKCPVTRVISKVWEDSDTVPAYLWKAHKPDREPPNFSRMIASHILRHALKGQDLATWEALETFTGLSLQLYRDNIQSTQNAILLEAACDASFDALDLGFEPEPESLSLNRDANDPYRCKLVLLSESLLQRKDYPADITFSNHLPPHHPLRKTHYLPDPLLLLAHLRLARVLHSRAMAEHLTNFANEEEATRVHATFPSASEIEERVAEWRNVVAT